jgi:hypothetical protein
MSYVNIGQHRLQNQLLLPHTIENPAEVVSHLVAVQAQEYAPTLWAIGLRLPGTTEPDIEQAVIDGTILRTHVMRPTWHFVTAADIRWLLALTAPRVHAVNAYMYRQSELDDATLFKTDTILADALQGSRYLTRNELAAELEQAGITAERFRLAYIVMHAELEGIICNGPRRGKQFTYALLDERVPPTRTLERDEALAGLVRRFFTGHGPARVQDFVWWSGLTVADAQAGLHMVGSQLTHQEAAGESYWFSENSSTGTSSPAIYLLPTYDEYLIAYKNRENAIDPAAQQMGAADFTFDSTIVEDGRIIGTWKRTLQRSLVTVILAPFLPPTDVQHQRLLAAAERYAQFLNLPLSVELLE